MQTYAPSLDVPLDVPRDASADAALEATQRVVGSREEDAVRLSVMFREHLDFVWRQVRRLGLSGAEAEDVTQRAFIVASRKLERIEPGRERAFLFTTATHLAFNARRGRARRREEYVEHELEDPRVSPEELVDQARARAIADKVLAAMEFDLRVVFVLFEIEELAIADIAALLAIPYGTVGSRLRRAREQFRDGAARFVRPTLIPRLPGAHPPTPDGGAT